MRIAVSATGSSIDSAADERFGRCAFFVVFDEQTGDTEAILNDGVSAAEGAGIKSAGLLLRNHVDVIITGRVGPKAMHALLAGRVAVYTGAAGTVARTMEQYRSGSLSPLGIPNARSHNGMTGTGKQVK